jgi:holin-like protein
MLHSIFAIFLFQLVGEMVQKYFALTVPGPVIGLLLLLLALLASDRLGNAAAAKYKHKLTATAETLLAHLPLLFVPIGVGVVMHISALESQLFAVLGVIFIGTLLTVGFSAVLMEKLQGRGSRNGG